MLENKSCELQRQIFSIVYGEDVGLVILHEAGSIGQTDSFCVSEMH